MEIERLFTRELIEKLKKDLAESDGQEIFLVGILDKNSGQVADYNLLARGNERMVPAIITDLKPGMIIIHNHPSGDLTPSAPDIRIASRVGNNGIGFAIINNEVDEVYVVVEPKLPEEEVLLDPVEIVSFFEPGGGLSQQLADYEYRPQQLKVVEAVINSFNDHQEIFIEAGTGTGKSFAYLIPALYWSHLNKSVVVVSTNTINLQEQLIDKDLVLLKKVLPFPFKAILVKGRSNYLCKRKLKNLETRAKELFLDDPEKEVEFIRILNWFETTETGSRSDLDFVLQTDLWDELASESDLCLRTNCPYFDSCFFMQARKEVYSADLLVVNHHLLVADALLKNETQDGDAGILPRYRNLIIDEAHNFPDTATSYLGRPFLNLAAEKYLQKLFSNRYSFLPRLRDKLSNLDTENKKKLQEMIDSKIIPLIQKLFDLNGSYRHQFEGLFPEGEDEVRITQVLKETPHWQNVQDAGELYLNHLGKLGLLLNELYEELLNLKADTIHRFEELLMELEAYLLRCQLLFNNLDFNLQAADEDYVFWLEKSSRTSINQKNAPLEIASQLRELLWGRLDNLVLTSATLTVNHSFDFFKRQMGLEKSQELIAASPFDYQEQVKLIIPQDIPPANSPVFLEEVIDGLREMLVSFGGKTLVLFTSYSMLTYCVKNLESDLQEKGITILSQDKFPRNYIIKCFKKNERQIIFGTVSFWEGIDIKGDKLQYLIIMKLPFPVPSEPVAAARMELMEKEGLNPFIHYSLPRAVIRLKQGFGRLIRSRKDRGIIVILDNRLLTKSYGKVFLNSLPACPVVKSCLNEISERWIVG